MSIIQEALKKAEPVTAEKVVPLIPVEKIHPAAPRADTVFGRPKPQPVKKKKLSPILILGPVALVAILAAAFFAVNGKIPHGKAKEAPLPKVEAAAKDALPADGAIPAKGAFQPFRQEVVRNDQGRNEAQKAPLGAQKTIFSSPPKFFLSGIMFIQSSPRAIVNGSVVREGDLISGAKVKKIDKSDVVLDYGDFEVLLNIND